MLQARGAASALALAENLTYGDDDDRYNYSETGWRVLPLDQNKKIFCAWLTK